jgi:hypothetical protein
MRSKSTCTKDQRAYTDHKCNLSQRRKLPQCSRGCKEEKGEQPLNDVHVGRAKSLRRENRGSGAHAGRI